MRRASKANQTARPRARRVAILGAGPAGICVARHLLEEGFEITVYEKGSHIGGLWVYENDSGESSAYRTLHINTAKAMTAYQGYPFPPEVQAYPDHVEMRRYLDDYADHFGVRSRVRFRSPVTAVRPQFRPGTEPPRWEVETPRGSECYDAVVVATGHLASPRHVSQFRDGFGGEYLHAHYYREPDAYVGKAICVVGVGNSAVDIASDVCVNARTCVLVARSGVVITPKFIFGIPFTDIMMHLSRPWIPGRVRRFVTRWSVRITHGDMQRYGFKPLDAKAHPTSSATVISHIAYNRVRVKQGIERIEGRRIFFADGTNEEFDVLIAATGYVVDLPFLSADVVPVDDNIVDLYLRIAAPEWPGLYFVGMLNSTTALPQVFERQTTWLIEHLAGRAALPSADEMRAAIEARRMQIAREYIGSPRHALEEEHMAYFRALKRSLRADRRRAHRTRTPVHLEEHASAAPLTGASSPTRRDTLAAARNPGSPDAR
jgi:cation diffusion facilitator CzcD-associated flavoprotein CzcO